MDNIEELFDKVIIEAEDGIKIKNTVIRFHTLEKYSLNSSYNDGIPILVIKNKKELLNKLKQYLELVVDVKKIEVNKNSLRKCIALLFSNACFEDFSNPTRFIDNHINFYLNNEFLENDKVVGNIVIKRITQSIYSETPYAFKAYLVDNDKKLLLANISYGISDNVCYIYKMDEVCECNSIKDIDDISLSIFLQELYLYGISKVKIVSCLPLRDNSIQCSLNSLLNRFTSLNYVNNSIKITSNPFEFDEYMNVELDELNQDFESIIL